jgi:hypothetical protein
MLATLTSVGSRTFPSRSLPAAAALLTAVGQTRAVSSSPYGRTHVWKHRQRKLPNPVVPRFPQRVIRADGSSFVHYITSPRSLLRLTRDVTNAPLWNVDILSNEGAQDESATSGRLGRFNRRFADDAGLDWMTEADSGNAEGELSYPDVAELKKEKKEKKRRSK